MAREDIECIIKWFSHIEQLATDGKTANGFQMPSDELLATIKVVAKDGREYVEKFCDGSTPKDLEEASEEYRQGEVDTGSDYIDDSDGDSLYRSACLADAFKAGAKWQEEKDQETIKLAEDHAFLAGADWQKEQMLKDNPVIMSVEDFQALIDSHAKRVVEDYKEQMMKEEQKWQMQKQ